MKAALKTTRAWEPLNHVLTSMFRWLFDVLHMRWDFVLRHLPRVGLVRCRLPNGRMMRIRSEGDEHIPNQLYWFGWDGYEPETARVFFRAATRGGVIVDVGAHVGYYAILAALASEGNRVFAFEPLPLLQQRLRHNLELNGARNVECVGVALGETEGTLPLYYTPRGGGMNPSLYRGASSLARGALRGTEHVSSMRVPIVPLDAFLEARKVNRVDLVKIDTETTEPQVLRGMARTLARDHPMLICEVLPEGGTAESLEEILAEHGYRYYLLTEDGPVSKRRIEPDRGYRWRNYLFTMLPMEELKPLFSP
jgi:FkbM family methyltransferase